MKKGKSLALSLLVFPLIFVNRLGAKAKIKKEFEYASTWLGGCLWYFLGKRDTE